MDYNDLKKVLVSRLGERDDLLPNIETEVKIAQDNLERSWGHETMPWFLAKNAQVQIPAGYTSVDMPTDFLRERDEAATLYNIYVSDGDFFPDRPGEWQYAEKVFPEDLTVAEINPASLTLCGQQKLQYALYGSSVRISATHDTPVSLMFDYYGSEPTLSDTSLENEWTRNAFELLVAKTGASLAKYIHDAALAGTFAADMQQEAVKIIEVSKQRAHANLEMVVVRGVG